MSATKKKSFSALIKTSSTPVLVDFYANWCGPCQTLSPIVQQVSKELGDQVKVIKIDIDKNPAAAQRFQVRSIPTLMIFKEGKVLWRKAGLMTKRELISSVQKAIQSV